INTTKHEFQPEEVMAFLDGELSAERAAALSHHLRQCQECAAVATGFKRISRKLSTWTVEPLPARAANRLTSAGLGVGAATALPPSALPTRARPSFLKWGFGTVAGVLVFFLASAALIPNLLRSGMAANESSAVGSLRTLNTAAISYQSSYSNFPLSLRSFGPPHNGASSAVRARKATP